MKNLRLRAVRIVKEKGQIGWLNREVLNCFGMALAFCLCIEVAVARGGDPVPVAEIGFEDAKTVPSFFISTGQTVRGATRE